MHLVLSDTQELFIAVALDIYHISYYGLKQCIIKLNLPKCSTLLRQLDNFSPIYIYTSNRLSESLPDH